jgi:lactate dehydrogenase-like 2-hydroxyacid dehydrogenase
MKIVVLDGYAINPGDLSWTELDGLTLGIIGFGRIGRATADAALATSKAACGRPKRRAFSFKAPYRLATSHCPLSPLIPQ